MGHVVLRKALLTASPVLAVLLAGCMTSSSQMTFVRADGRAHATDAVLAQQYELAAQSCRGGATERFQSARGGSSFSQRDLPKGIAQSNRSTASGAISESCMADQGYVMVTKDQADAKLAELAAAEERRKREAAPQMATPGQRSR